MSPTQYINSKNSRNYFNRNFKFGVLVIIVSFFAFYAPVNANANGCFSASDSCSSFNEGFYASYDAWSTGSASLLTTSYWMEDEDEDREVRIPFWEPDLQFLMCQRQWAEWSDECVQAITQRSLQVKDFCSLLGLAVGGSSNGRAAAFGCYLGAVHAEGNAEETCGREAIEGILENCLG